MGVIRSLIDSKVNKCKVAHFHVYHFAFRELLSVLFFWSARIPIVLTVHDIESFDRFGRPESLSSRLRSRLMVSMAKSLIVHNTFAKSKIIEKFGSLVASKINVVPSGDLDFLYKSNVSKEQARAELGLDPEHQIILFFGQIKKVKGLDILIEAMKYIKSENVKLIVVGKVWKDDLFIYKSLAESNNVSDAIEWRSNYVKNEIVPLYFKSADVVVLPYKLIYNSSVLLRSMDYGVPVVASNIPVFREIIDDNINALLFESEDSRSLANSILKVLNDECLAKSMIRNSMEYIKTNNSRARIGQLMIDIYRNSL